MSLFKTKDWWRTECGDLRESFDGQSLLVAERLLGHNRPYDAIVVASHAGYLRIYEPNCHWDAELNMPSPFKSTDLVVEAKLADAILDVKAGKFISGSQDEHLAILTPSKLVVYIVTLAKGTVEQGDGCQLQAAYEHQLRRFPASLVTGAFGGARGRDFLCVQCLDGTLLFYEQEVFSFSRTLKSRLLPEPLIYVARNDVFVTLGPGWNLECYRYQNIAELGRKEDAEGKETRKDLIPDWSYNIGEPILDINVVMLSSFEVGILVLGERTLYCLGDSCTSIKSAKRLEYSPLCFQAYVIEPDGKLMTMVVADTSTLMIYEGTTLKWTAQLPFLPVAVTRAQLQNLDGAIVVLSDDGRLEACYLGSEPSLFVAPPINRRGFDYVAAERELLEMRAERKREAANESDDELLDAEMEAELTMNVHVSPELLPSPRDTDRDRSTSTKKNSSHSCACKLEIELSAYSPITEVQLIVQPPYPLAVTDDVLDLPSLCEKYKFETTVYLEGESPPPSSAEVIVVALYMNEEEEMRVLRKDVQLPVRMLLRPAPSETVAPFSLTIKSVEPILNFSQLFPELVGEYTSKQITNSLGLQHAKSGSTVTLLASGVMQQRYRVQSADGLAVPLVFQQLVARIKDKAPAAAEKLSCALGQQQLQLLQDKVDKHFEIRLKVRAGMKELGLLTTQLRNIEKRMLRGMRERNSRSLAATGLPALLDSTYRAIFALLDDLQAGRAEQEQAWYELQGALRLVLQIVKMNASKDKYEMLEAALCFEPQHRDEFDWEEMTELSLASLNRSLSRSITDSRPVQLEGKLESQRELAKLKKRLVHALEKVNSSGLAENQVVMKESPAEELAAGNVV